MEYLGQSQLLGRHPLNITFELSKNFFEKTLWGEGRVIVHYDTGKEEKIGCQKANTLYSWKSCADFLSECVEYRGSLPTKIDLWSSFAKGLRDTLWKTYIYREKQISFRNRESIHIYKNHNNGSLLNKGFAEILSENVCDNFTSYMEIEVPNRGSQWDIRVNFDFGKNGGEKKSLTNIIQDITLDKWIYLIIGDYAIDFIDNWMQCFERRNINIHGIEYTDMMVLDMFQLARGRKFAYKYVKGTNRTCMRNIYDGYFEWEDEE